MYEHLTALEAASYEAHEHLPHIKIELCGPCHGLKFTANYGIYHAQHIISWTEFIASREPMKLLINTIGTMRRSVSKMVP